MSDGQVTGDALTFEIGRLAILAGNVESHVDWILQVLVAPEGDDGRVGQVVAGMHQFARRVHLAKALLSLRLGEQSPAHELAEPIKDYLTSADAFMKTRNRLLHAIWMIYGQEETATLLRRGAKEMETLDLSLPALRAHVAEGERLADLGGTLWQELIYRYGHLDALIAATEELQRRDPLEGGPEVRPS